MSTAAARLSRRPAAAARAPRAARRCVRAAPRPASCLLHFRRSARLFPQALPRAARRRDRARRPPRARACVVPAPPLRADPFLPPLTPCAPPAPCTVVGGRCTAWGDACARTCARSAAAPRRAVARAAAGEPIKIGINGFGRIGRLVRAPRGEGEGHRTPGWKEQQKIFLFGREPPRRRQRALRRDRPPPAHTVPPQRPHARLGVPKGGKGADLPRCRAPGRPPGCCPRALSQVTLTQCAAAGARGLSHPVGFLPIHAYICVDSAARYGCSNLDCPTATEPAELASTRVGCTLGLWTAARPRLRHAHNSTVDHTRDLTDWRPMFPASFITQPAG